MNPTSTVDLEFNPVRNDLGKDKLLRDGLSAALQIGDTLWIANDESISLERLTLINDNNTGNYRHGRHHKQFSLNDYLRLPEAHPCDSANREEVDVEGLDYENGYLWLVGSHSLKRKKPKLKDGIKEAQKQLAKVSMGGNCYLLARIPVVEGDGTYTLKKDDTQQRECRTAAQLRGNAEGNDLTAALSGDQHLGSFLAIPGKDNGFDIEGLAVAGERLFLGLRGPVLRGWAMILEVAPKEDDNDPSTLRLNKFGPDQRPYRKHFLQLGGLGIRDLCVQGSDLLILAGPTMNLDGPVTVFRWPGGTKPKNDSVVPADELERVLDIPYGQDVDHAEGMTLFSQDGGTARSLLVVYDSASESRQSGESTVTADVFLLPRTS
ncbi:MAG: DUF3616 domain-containing protein [Steroidobacteraceae bacterium]|nr:DUF3616 domain-containing protein [Deltaproteobacteria bacterium]